MKKGMIFLLTVLLLVGVAGCTDPEEITSALDSYCDNNPESEICENPDATRDVIVSDMFNTVMVEFLTGTNETFCEDYFAHEGLKDTCINDRMSMLPSDYGNLGPDMVISEGSSASDFEIQTKYTNGENAYLFTVSVIEQDGIFKFVSFGYDGDSSGNPSTVNLNVSTEDILFMMRDLFNHESDATCSMFFSGIALTECNGDIDSMIGPYYIAYSPEVQEIGTNRFLYTAKSNDTMQLAHYDITFVLVNNELRLSNISFVLGGEWNKLTHVTKQMGFFKLDFNDEYYTVGNVCDDYFVPADANDCFDLFKPYQNNTITDMVVSEVSSLVYQVTFTFDDPNGSTIDFLFTMELDQYGYYELNATFDSSSTTPTDGLVLDSSVFNQFLLDIIEEEYINQLNGIYDVEGACSEYFVVEMYDDCVNDEYDYFFNYPQTDLFRYYPRGDGFDVVPMYEDEVLTYPVQSYPSFYIEVVSSGDTFKINYFEHYSLGQMEVIDAIDLMIDDALSSMSDTTFCDQYEWLDYTVSSKTCVSFRAGIKQYPDQTDFVTHKFYVDGIGTIQRGFSMIQNGVISHYAVELRYNGEEYVITGLWDEQLSNDIRSNTVQNRLRVMYLDQLYNPNFNCADYLLNADCDQLSIYHDILITDIWTEYQSVSTYIVSPVTYFDDNLMYGILYPVYKVVASLDGDVVKMTVTEYNKPTVSDITSDATTFETDLLDTTKSTSDFCSDYFYASNTACAEFRDEVLSGTTVTVELKEIDNGYGSTIFVTEVNVDGKIYHLETIVSHDETAPFIDHYWLFDEPVGSCSLVECPTCEVCEECSEPCDCTNNMVSYESIAKMIFEEFVEEFNDVEITDDTILAKYYQNNVSSFVSNRQNILLGGGVRIIDMNRLYSDSTYQGLQVTLGYMINAQLYQNVSDINIELFIEDVFHLHASNVVVTTSVSLAEATTVYSNFVSDYLNSSIGDTVLLSTWDYNNSLDVSSRLSFLVSGGTIELLGVEMEDFVYVAKIKETVNGVSTYYKHTFMPVDGTSVVIDFGSKTEYEDNTISNELEPLVLQYLVDISSGLYTNSQICAMYYDSESNCQVVRLADMDLLSITFTMTETPWTILYTVDYGGYVETMKLVTNAEILDGEVTFSNATTELVSTNQYYATTDDANLGEMMSLIQQYIDDYYDILQTSESVCGTYVIEDVTVHDSCITYRNDRILNDEILDFISIHYVTEGYRDVNHKQYFFYVYLEGKHRDMDDPEIMQVMMLAVEMNETSVSGYRIQESPSGLPVSVFYPDSVTGFETRIQDLISYLNSPNDTYVQKCATLLMSIPGNPCMLDLYSVDGLDYIGYDYHILTGNYYTNASIMLTLHYDNNGETISIDLPIKYNFSNGYGASATVRYAEPLGVTSSEISDYVETYITDYFNSVITDASFDDTYGHPGNNALVYRQTDLNTYLGGNISLLSHSVYFYEFSSSSTIYIQIYFNVNGQLESTFMTYDYVNGVHSLFQETSFFK